MAHRRAAAQEEALIAVRVGIVPRVALIHSRNTRWTDYPGDLSSLVVARLTVHPKIPSEDPS